MMDTSDRQSDISLSIIVPSFNEQDSLDELVRQIDAALCETNIKYQIIFIDDGSTDASWMKIEALAATHGNIQGVRFRRNFGKAAALSAGFERATGEFLITMDADLQDDPQEIVRLIAKLQEGYDCVSGWKQRRHDPWHKVLPSRIFNAMISKLTGVRLHDHNCGLKAYRREVFSEVQIYGELHRFIPVLAAARGFRVSELVVNHRPRTSGVSKYGFERFTKGFLDLLTVYFLTGFRQRPQHLLGSAGLLLLVFGAAGLLLLSIAWCVTRMTTSLEPLHLHERAVFYFAILSILLGVQLISIGFLAELITAIHRPEARPYSIVQETQVQADEQL